MYRNQSAALVRTGWTLKLTEVAWKLDGHFGTTYWILENQENQVDKSEKSDGRFGPTWGDFWFQDFNA